MDGAGAGWSLITIIGPILLAAVILFAVIRNRQSSKASVRRTEAATRDLYQEQDAADKALDEKVER